MANTTSDYERWPYQLCAHCDHFVELDDNGGFNDGPIQSFASHLDDGEQPEYDHDPAFSGIVRALADWRDCRPDLFRTYPDGKIGPNSCYFVPDLAWRTK